MCEFEESICTYRDCRLPQYSSLGRPVAPHEIVSKYIHQCADPRPAHGSTDTVCEKRYQQNLKPVRNPDDRGHTKVTGPCPACKAAEDRCLEVTIIPLQNVATRNSVINEPTATQPVVEQHSDQNRAAGQIRLADPVTNHAIEPNRRSNPRPSVPGSRSERRRRHNDDNSPCCTQ